MEIHNIKDDVYNNDDKKIQVKFCDRVECSFVRIQTQIKFKTTNREFEGE